MDERVGQETGLVSTVHFAGTLVTVDGIYRRQRCSWCGFVLIDEDLSKMMVIGSRDPADRDPGHGWKEGSLVEVTGNHSALVSLEECCGCGRKVMPENCCARRELDA